MLDKIKPSAPITIVPHLALHGVPFAALPLADGTPLVETHALGFAPSLTTLRQLHTRAQQTPAPPPAGTSAHLVVGGAITATSFELPLIPATAREARDVAQTLGVSNMPTAAAADPAVAAAATGGGGLLVGADATAEIVGRVLASSELRCVHLACHSRPNCLALGKMSGLLRADSPDGTGEVAVSKDDETAGNGGAKTAVVDVTDGVDSVADAVAAGLELSAEAKAMAEAVKAEEKVEAEVEAEAEAEAALGPTASGLLTLEALAELPLLSYPTIVITGSHGAAGQLSQDGVLGIRRSFLAAGARSVLAAAWDTADEPTHILMKAFYAALTVESPPSQAQALRVAMRALRAADGGKWDHPAYWASWSVVGAARGI